MKHSRVLIILLTSVLCPSEATPFARRARLRVNQIQRAHLDHGSIHLLRHLRAGQQYPLPPDDSPEQDFYEPVDTNMYNNEDVPFPETVQERLDHWKAHQREYSATAQQQPRDEQGRMKLLISVSRGSRAIIFFLLMIRDIHLYEVADKVMRAGIFRKFSSLVLITLFCSNLSGVVVTLTSTPGQKASKKRLKAIMNLDKLLEVALIFYSVTRLTIFPPKHTPREIYIGNIFHSLLFLLQCQAFTKMSWDEAAAPSMTSYNHQQQPYRPSVDESVYGDRIPPPPAQYE